MLKRALVIGITLLFISVGIASAHDLFLKPVRYFVEENADVLVRVLNGTFSKSENSIARTRLRDVSIVSPTGRATLDTSAWSADAGGGGGGDTSSFYVRTTGSGTYVIGVSTKPNVIALKAKDFNAYLREDGIPDALDARRRDKELNRDVRECYSKHVKALVQVGRTRSDQFSTELGYPAELIPLDNPYTLSPGSVLRVRTVIDGNPTANQFVLFGGRRPDGARIAQRSTRSDAEGVARVPLRVRGTWYVKFINMSRVSGDTVDYESKWATLTFMVR
jgi:uncharacterized GH25 family protein